jgi:hypothetical protein
MLMGNWILLFHANVIWCHLTIYMSFRPIRAAILVPFREFCFYCLMNHVLYCPKANLGSSFQKEEAERWI